jgi:hypothetical protein
MVFLANIPSIPDFRKRHIGFEPDLSKVAENEILSSIDAVNLISLTIDKNLKIILVVRS